MNGDTSETMDEPMETATANEQNNMPQPKKEKLKSEWNSTNSDNSNDNGEESDDDYLEDGDFTDHKVNSDDSLMGSQDDTTDGPPEDVQESKSDYGEDESMDSHKDDSNDGSLEQIDSQDFDGPPEQSESPAYGPNEQSQSPVYDPPEQNESPVYDGPPKQSASPVFEPPEQSQSPIHDGPFDQSQSPIREGPPEQSKSPVYDGPPEQSQSPVLDGPREQSQSPVLDGPPEQSKSPVYDGPPEQSKSPVYDGPPEQTESLDYDGPLEQTDSQDYDGPPVQKDTQDSANNSDKFSEDTKSQDVANHSEDSLGDCQHEVYSDLSEQENDSNEVESLQNSDDDSSETGEDTAGNTIYDGTTDLMLQQNVTNKLDVANVKTESFQIVTINEHHSDDEMESMNSEYSGSEDEIRAEETVSIHSDSDDPPALKYSPNNSEIKERTEIMLLNKPEINNHNGTSQSPEVQEIISDNDDCLMTAEEQLTKNIEPDIAVKAKKGPKATDSKVELRRSSRTIKRKKYDDDIQALDDESDVEEVVMEDPLKQKSKNIYINTTKTLLDNTVKHGKSYTNQKKDTTVVIIDPIPPVKNRIPVNKTAASTLSQSIYQRIVSRGTSVTPVNSINTAPPKNMVTQGTQVSPTPPPPPILPTLTDDMFVVEAPSFIVPYVYEKPPKLPFKEFVNQLGKEIEEETAKEELALLEKKKEEKAKREQEKKERGEEVDGSEEEVESDELKKKKAEKSEKKERRRRKKEDDDESWDGSCSSESEDEDMSDEDSPTTIIKDKADAIDGINAINAVPGLAIEGSGKSENYFDLFLGKFFMNIGLNLVQEYVQTDLLKQQNRKLQREKRSGHDLKDRELSIALLTKNLELSQKTNESFTFDQIKCEFCTFKTESTLTMAHHLETPHMKNNLYKCNYCPFEIRSPHDILYHMDKEHNVKGRLERTPALHQCSNCPFEDHGKGKLARHIIACAKKFKSEINLAPPLEWEHPAKIAKMQRTRPNTAPYQVAQFGRNHDGFAKMPIPIGNAVPPMYRGRGRAPPRVATPLPVPTRPSGVLIRQCTPGQNNYAINNTKKAMHPSISITPLPRPTNTFSPSIPMQSLHGAKGFVICEICDGYIKDLEQLRNHMQWIHKVKIHPKMIYNRPPLNCQKCQFRFFTDQGLERHLLGSHGLVTNSMQDAANRGQDAGRCPVCGRVYQWKLLGHVARDHNLLLKPAHLSYKCTVCTATFSMYRQFENHVYSAHSVVAKKVMDKKPGTAASKANDNDYAAKQLKINDEITITPQPMKIPGAGASKGK